MPRHIAELAILPNVTQPLPDPDDTLVQVLYVVLPAGVVLVVGTLLALLGWLSAARSVARIGSRAADGMRSYVASQTEPAQVLAVKLVVVGALFLAANYTFVLMFISFGRGYTSTTTVDQVVKDLLTNAAWSEAISIAALVAVAALALSYLYAFSGMSTLRTAARSVLVPVGLCAMGWGGLMLVVTFCTICLGTFMKDPDYTPQMALLPAACVTISAAWVVAALFVDDLTTDVARASNGVTR